MIRHGRCRPHTTILIPTVISSEFTVRQQNTERFKQRVAVGDETGSGGNGTRRPFPHRFSHAASPSGSLRRFRGPPRTRIIQPYQEFETTALPRQPPSLINRSAGCCRFAGTPPHLGAATVAVVRGLQSKTRPRSSDVYLQPVASRAQLLCPRIWTATLGEFLGH
ncbi:hypothetical protein DFP72DRAFT_1082783 [Ephemerocybe angulata]|uniref:Uncharacterized protein n=1 Tax=Ephemerocybe angulata TaxID=980116 RepID=A0A8H6H9J3_9AGAR|nr:hypothetical protein DFP72DRAFT_1082783 [Tulosesus angulatus]